MIDYFRQLFDSSGFMPHGHCYLWQPHVVWIHVASDALITVSYYSIPLLLVYFVHKRRDIPYPGLMLMFSRHASTSNTPWTGRLPCSA